MVTQLSLVAKYLVAVFQNMDDIGKRKDGSRATAPARERSDVNARDTVACSARFRIARAFHRNVVDVCLVD